MKAEDLVEALKEGVIAGAGTDVFCNEPPKMDDPLLNCPNLIVSPHSAAQTREAVIYRKTLYLKHIKLIYTLYGLQLIERSIKFSLYLLLIRYQMVKKKE